MKEERPLNEKEWEYPPMGLRESIFYKKDVAHKIKRLKAKWRAKCKRMEIMSGDVAIFELESLIEEEIGDLK